MKIESSAPTNIALIKYMGKEDSQANLPTNSSLSWTLDDLRTHVHLTLREDLTEDRWQALQGPGFETLNLSQSAKNRFLRHFQFLKSEWGMKKKFSDRVRQ